MGDLQELLAAMRVPRAFRSCYSCANRYGCGVVGAPLVPLMMDEGQQCGFWRPQEMSFIPSEIELAGLKMHQEQEKNRRGRKVEKGYCGRPEWADEEGCPMDNPNEEMKDCAGCRWFKETEGQE